MTLRIKDWDKVYENAHSRKVDKARWLPIPNKHDGKGYRRIVAMKNGAEIYAAWVLILQIASKMPERGTLKDEDGDITTEDMALMTGFPESLFERAIPALKTKKISWLEDDSTEVEPDSTPVKEYGSEGKEGKEGKEPDPPVVDTPSVLSFQDFWDLYDKKADRAKSEKKFAKISEADRAKIKNTLGDYVALHPDPQFRKNPCTYLNGQCWNDEITTEQNPEGIRTTTI